MLLSTYYDRIQNTEYRATWQRCTVQRCRVNKRQVQRTSSSAMAERPRYLLWLRRYKRKSIEVGVFRRGVGHFERRFQREVGVANPTTAGVRVAQWLPFCVVSKYQQCIIELSQSTRVTDRWTDGQNYDSQDCPRICSSGKNTTVVSQLSLTSSANAEEPCEHAVSLNRVKCCTNVRQIASEKACKLSLIHISEPTRPY